MTDLVSNRVDIRLRRGFGGQDDGTEEATEKRKEMIYYYPQNLKIFRIEPPFFNLINQRNLPAVQDFGRRVCGHFVIGFC